MKYIINILLKWLSLIALIFFVTTLGVTMFLFVYKDLIPVVSVSECVLAFKYGIVFSIGLATYATLVIFLLSVYGGVKI